MLNKLTLPLKPFWGVSEIVLEPLAPSMRVRLLGEVESVKFGAGVEEALSEMLSKVAGGQSRVAPAVRRQNQRKRSAPC